MAGDVSPVAMFHVVMFVYRSGEHSAETLHIIIYKSNEAMTKLQRLVQ